MTLLDKTILRSLWRNRFFAGLNILGLSIGICASWIIFRLVVFEYSFDKHIPEKEQVYQVVSRNLFEGNESGYDGIGKAIVPVLQQLDAVELIVPLYFQEYQKITVGDELNSNRHFEKSGKQVKTSPEYFKLFPYKWLAGDPKDALTDPGKIVLTEQRAKEYFPQLSIESIPGNILVFDDSIKVQVTGIVQPIIGNSSYEINEFMSFQKSELLSDDWMITSERDQLLIKFLKNNNPQLVLSKLNQLNEDHTKPELAKINMKHRYALLPITEKHFTTAYSAYCKTADKSILNGLMALAAFLLLLASINYINLSTARMPQRTAETGIRKILGSSFRHLIFRFLNETIILVVLSVAFSFPLVLWAKQLLKDFLPEGMFAYADYPSMIVFLILLIIAVTILAGIYPAIQYGRSNSLRLIKPIANSGKQIFTLRKGLIVFQFLIAQVFIVCSIVVALQLKYMLTKDVGFEKAGIINVDVPEAIKENQNLALAINTFKTELQKSNTVEMISVGDKPMDYAVKSLIFVNPADTAATQHQLYLKYADSNYVGLYKMKMIAGNNIHSSNDLSEMVINEMAVKELGFASPLEAIGKPLKLYNSGRIIIISGVVKDFHQFGLQETLKPGAIVYAGAASDNISIRFASKYAKDWKQGIQYIEDKWKQFFPGVDFEYGFYDQFINDYYEEERKMGNLIRLASTVSIFISCIGLFGLVTLVTFQRTKEIGIRKVMGSSVKGIVSLVSKDFIKLVLVAAIIATPIAAWAMHEWLNGFAYRIEMSWWIFVVAILLGLAVALLTISYQSIKAALANPVKALRGE